MRGLKEHEKRLLKKVDFIQWGHEQNIREAQVTRRYMLSNREQYGKYNNLCGNVKKLTNEIANLDPNDPFKQKMTNQLVDKLYIFTFVLFFKFKFKFKI